MNRLLAFVACATIAALLLMRILPGLVPDLEQEAKLEAPNAQIEVSVTNALSEETPESPSPLLLPPPPMPKTPASPEAKQVAETPKSSTRVSKGPRQALPEIDDAVSTTEPLETPIARESELLFEAAPGNKAAIEAPSQSGSRPATDLTEKKAQTATPSSENTKTGLDPLPRPSPVARSEDQFVSLSPTVEAEGRVLLRILEHGSGPEIEIAWPVSDIQRRALYRLFRTCYGMEIAVMDSSGRLFSRKGEAGRPWQPNLDRYSGFVRQPSGRLTLDEKDSIAHIRTFHGGLRATANVRMFPRRLDALLLGGFKTLIGDGYADASAIRAHYRRDGDMVLVERIRLDRRPILGRIDLSAAAGHCRSGAWS